MNERKAVVWFADEPQPNTFFFRSPFRSWKFLINTILLVAACIGLAYLFWNYSIGFKSFPIYLLPFLLLNAVYPYWYALKRHGRIREHYLSGAIPEQNGGTPLNDLLEVADNSLNEGLRNSITLLILVMYLLKFRHLT